MYISISIPTENIVFVCMCVDLAVDVSSIVSVSHTMSFILCLLVCDSDQLHCLNNLPRIASSWNLTAFLAAWEIYFHVSVWLQSSVLIIKSYSKLINGFNNWLVNRWIYSFLPSLICLMTEGSVPDPWVDKDVIYIELKAIKELICILKGFFFYPCMTFSTMCSLFSLNINHKLDLRFKKS